MNPNITSKEAILQTCRNIVASKGLPALNMRSVAEECHIALGTLYNYYSNKNELLLATIESVWKDIFHTNHKLSTDFLFYEYPEAANVADITNVTLNKNICEYIDEHAFTGSNITELNFQGLGLISIEDQAFYGSKLTKITLPDTLERIESSAFAYCDNLRDIWYEGTVDDWKGIQKSPMWRDGTSNLKVHTMRDHKVITYK